MPFAQLPTDLSYWKKQTSPLFADLSWNFPEQKTGRVAVLGGHSQGFNGVIRLAEALTRNFPIRDVQLLLPNALRGKLPPLANINYAPSTASGSFARSTLLATAIRSADFAILAGDLSKNAETAIALGEAIVTASDHQPPNHQPSAHTSSSHTTSNYETSNHTTLSHEASNSTTPNLATANHAVASHDTPSLAATPLLLTRDAIDTLAPSANTLLAYPRLFLVASMVQLQKIFRAVFYPRMIMLSQPLLPIVETLHKFTLSYPNTTILTFHEGEILVASAGQIVSTPITSTTYSPISLWSGPLAARVAAFNLFNPTKPLEATAAAILE